MWRKTLIYVNVFYYKLRLGTMTPRRPGSVKAVRKMAKNEESQHITQLVLMQRPHFVSSNPECVCCIPVFGFTNSNCAFLILLMYTYFKASMPNSFQEKIKLYSEISIFWCGCVISVLFCVLILYFDFLGASGPLFLWMGSPLIGPYLETRIQWSGLTECRLL